MSLKRFTEQPDSSMDYRIFKRRFVGNITPKRLQVLADHVKRYTQSFDRCNHSHDCCGCISSQTMTLVLSANGASLRLTESYNY